MSAKPADDDGDDEILAGIAARDPEALKRAHARYARPLHSVAYRILRSQRECEEVVQDVLVALWRKGHTVDLSRGKLFSWLAAVLRNRCIDRVRALNRRIPGPPAEVEDRPNREQITDETADQLVAAKERSEKIRAVMATLPEAQQEVIELAFFGGMSHSDVAAKLDISLGTVKSRIRYGLSKLRNTLGGKEVEES